MSGTYMGMTRNRRKIYTIDDDCHTLCIGSTGSGKTRCNSLPSICALALSGESMIISDPKSELYLYTYPFLEQCGYEVIAIDFKSPRKSSRYNFLQPVIDAVNRKDVPLAVTRAQDIAAMIAQSETHAERIWTDGERAVLSSAILAVAYDNQQRPEYQTMTSVYHFIGKMCKAESGDTLPIREYIKAAGYRHPAAAALDISEIAPSKMRGSFYTSALVALQLFAAPDIYDMTCGTDFDIYTTGSRKRAIFIILPDSKDAFYVLASLFVYQHYQTLVEECEKSGNRLARRVNFVLDEFGNFTKIPEFDKHITVGRSRGIKYSLYLQDLNQLNKIYGNEAGKIIRSNCDAWIYLGTNSQDTVREISDRLGKYTIRAPSVSQNSGGNSSASYSYTARELLTPDEIRKIKRPYQLIMTGSYPAIMYAPDISKTPFNRMLGMGGREHNIRLIKERGEQRTGRKGVNPDEVKIWRIWEKFTKGGDSGQDDSSYEWNEKQQLY